MHYLFWGNWVLILFVALIDIKFDIDFDKTEWRLHLDSWVKVSFISIPAYLLWLVWV